jgi:hypothetical protein
MTDFVSFAHNHVIALAPITVFVEEYFLILRGNWSPFHTSVTKICAVCSHVYVENSDVSQ